MKKINYPLVIIMMISLAFISCTKVIDLKLGNASGQLVIEGNFTNVIGPQYVKLSKNVSFTSTNTYPPVTGAQVVLSDANGRSFNFIEGPAGTYSITPLAGIPGNTFEMTVKVNGQTYTAYSTMPRKVSLDTLTEQNKEFNNTSNKKEIMVNYQDPSGVANQYCFVMYVNGVQVKRIFAFDDEFTDGKFVNNVLREDDIDIYPGDTVKVEMQCIDKPIYTYWYTLMQQQDNGPGGSVTPSNPPTNILPVTLGYFSAHTSQSKTLIVK